MKNAEGVPLKLSHAERWILANQYEILSRLDPEDDDYYRRAQKVITDGYSIFYGSYSNLGEEVPEGTCREVIEILNMFRAISDSLDAAGELEGIEDWELRFAGFDGNYETIQYAFARFLVVDEGKWRELSDSGDDLNSHAPTLERYRSMLAKWKEMGSPHTLSPQQLEGLASARAKSGNESGDESRERRPS